MFLEKGCFKKSSPQHNENCSDDRFLAPEEIISDRSSLALNAPEIKAILKSLHLLLVV
jgi:hypothetical protein